MPKETLKYTNDDITVVWKPKTCIHSTICWKGLIDVFNPKERPWIKMGGATTEQIIEQVRKCPSGALSYYLNADEPGVAGPGKIVGETATVLRIEVTPNGPYIIRNECRIVHADGNEETKTGNVALCRCGNSGNKPYCDGSHRKTGFAG
jgi:uncharacterized Fe-S cluster protein YjdI